MNGFLILAFTAVVVFAFYCVLCNKVDSVILRLARWWPSIILFCVGILIGMLAYNERDAVLKMMCDFTGGKVVYDNNWYCSPK